MMELRLAARLFSTPLLLTPLLLTPFVSALALFGATRHATPNERPADPVAALLQAYPEFLERIADNTLVWKDGARMRIDDGKGDKPFDAILADPDIKDMFAMTYPAGDKGIPPAVNSDPGRVRYMPLFMKMYGDCRAKNLAAEAGRAKPRGGRQ